MGTYAPVWAHMSPARALEEWERFRKNAAFFVRHTFFPQIMVFDLHMMFFVRFNVFFRFLTEVRFRTIIKLHQKAGSRTKTCSFGTSCTLPQVTVCT